MFSSVKMNNCYLLPQPVFIQFSYCLMDKLFHQCVADLYIFTSLEINYCSTYCRDHFFFCLVYNKTIIRFGLCDNQNYQGRGRDYKPKPKALIIVDITKSSSDDRS